jgi:hypothetical protein
MILLEEKPIVEVQKAEKIANSSGVEEEKLFEEISEKEKFLYLKKKKI